MHLTQNVNIYYIKSEKLVTSIAKVLEAPSFKVYPNPATDKVFVNITEPTEIGVFNISGQLLVHKLVESSHDHISLQNLPTGMYLVKALKKGGSAQKLIVK